MATIESGMRVRLTGKHLRATGQYAGAAGVSVWTVQAIVGSQAVTDERLPTSYTSQMWSAEELAADPLLAFRRIHTGNLQVVR